jgi:hypothetical protein
MESSLHRIAFPEYVLNVHFPGKDFFMQAITEENGYRKITGQIYPMSSSIVDGVMITYTLDAIRQIDPDLVGHATLFARLGMAVVPITMSGRLREKLLAAYEGLGTETDVHLIMYSGSITKPVTGEPRQQTRLLVNSSMESGHTGE